RRHTRSDRDWSSDVCSSDLIFYYYRSWWTDPPVLHLLPHWNWAGKEGQDIDVWCFSNCEEVELFLNGQSLGKKNMPRNSHLQWRSEERRVGKESRTQWWRYR